MYISQPLIGSALFQFDHVVSTNDTLKEMIAEKKAEHGTAVISRFQSTGRGQAGNKWDSEHGKNILCSICITPLSLKVADQVYLNFFACLSVFDVVNRFFPGRTKIKWPNDILVDGIKVAGILIENTFQGNEIKNSIIGIGINVRQQNFLYKNASSLSKLSGEELDTETVANKLFLHLNRRYEELSLHLKNKLMNDYLRVLT